MASSRKKQDEKNLKTLRELVSQPHNKYCFDCNQRGPTYVNVTIGSFVCTKCSGMLRGLTPPHRVKSISMATFTTEEIDLIRSRGNDYCKRVWLGLFEGTPPSDSRDEQSIRDFMVNKYEKKRYYLEPSKNGYATPISVSNKQHQNNNNNVRPLASLVSDAKPLRVNGNFEVNSKKNGSDFVADFSSADIFSSVSNNNGSVSGNGSAVQQDVFFANFDNNPVFSNAECDFSIFDLNFTNHGPVLNQVPLFPKCNVSNRWSMPTPAFLNNMNQQQKQNPAGPPAPPEDRYAALKDLDNALKAQPTLDWNSGSSNSLYSSPTPAGSVYSSPSPQGSMYGSPSQGQFASVFSPSEPNGSVFNPFNVTNGALAPTQSFANPFRGVPDVPKMNGFCPQWSPNPFKAPMGAASNNPFL